MLYKVWTPDRVLTVCLDKHKSDCFDLIQYKQTLIPQARSARKISKKGHTS
jgi:hypothetical protein